MSKQVKSEKPKVEKPKAEKPKAEKKSKQSTVDSQPLTARELRAALKGKNATERNQLRRANALAVKNERKAKAAQA